MIRIALAALSTVWNLDPRRSKMYFDVIEKHLSEAARRALQAMDPAKYEYQSDFAKRYVAEGRAEGEAKGRAALLIKLLALRFGHLAQPVEARLAEASIEELDQIGERLLTARTLEEAIASQ